MGRLPLYRADRPRRRAGGQRHTAQPAQQAPRTARRATLSPGARPVHPRLGQRGPPRGTASSEPSRIRRALIERYAIPADRIILEPYARHTTTNLRNATRRMVALGIPLDRPTLIVTDAQQSAYIESPTFITRNTAELG
ncbi:ElyC/SanA/YdcF family protein [Sphingomonas aerolata]